MNELLADVRAFGWMRGWFEYAKREVARGHSVDDARAADWTYFVDVGPQSRVLISGSHLLVTAAALAGRVQEVCVATADETEAEIVTLWRTQMGCANVQVAPMATADGLPFSSGTFDLVSVRAAYANGAPRRQIRFADLARDVRGALRPGGTARFVVDNRLFPPRFADAPARMRMPAHTIGGYRRVLRRLGFSNTRFFAPLPRHTRTPLCLLPLENRAALEMFLRDLFPVFATVSPEVKQAHAVEYMLARAGVWTLTHGRLGGLLKLLVPGYSVLTERSEIDAA